jgi:beta-barrel assembly-enhancing protease
MRFAFSGPRAPARTPARSLSDSRRRARARKPLAPYVLAAMLAACAPAHVVALPPSPRPATTPASNEAASQALADAAEASASGDTAKAASLYDRLIDSPDFASLSAKQQHDALLADGTIAFNATHDISRARSLILRSSSMPEATGQDWHLRLRIAIVARDTDEELKSTNVLLRNWPALARTLRSDLVFALARELRGRDRAGEPYYAFLDALFAVHWKMTSGSEPSRLWLDLATLRVERGDPEKAAAVIARVQDPCVLIAMRADARFAQLLRMNPEMFDVPAAMQREIKRLELAAEQAPRLIERINELGTTLLAAGRPADALELWDRVLRRAETLGPPEYDDLDTQLPWAMNDRARALYRLGDWRGAEEQIERARRLPEHGHSNTSQAINAAGYYIDVGDPERALRALGDVGEMSSFGRMQLESVRAVAAVQRHDTEMVKTALEYLREHFRDSPEALEHALVATGRIDEAAQLLKDRLADPKLRVDALRDVQSYRSRPAPPPAEVWRARWRGLVERPDVRAAIQAVGRRDAYEVCSGRY